MGTANIAYGPGETELLTRADVTRREIGEAMKKPANTAGLLRERVENANLLAHLHDEEGLANELACAVARRQQFWMDTCRQPDQMFEPCKATKALQCRFGAAYYCPSREQVQYILDALDSALPDWDENHPELFYQTLELNFPDLLLNRHRAMFRV